jgi:spermidine synthase
VRTLFNGRTLHGVQFLAAARRSTPTAYYGRRSGVGRLMGAPAGASRSVAVVGLGAGTLAAYGRKGETFRFYEINPAVIEAASSDFKFLADSAATTDIVQGDGRLCLEREAPHSFNVIVLDAFSDDAIPVHLLTREAFQLYFRLLRDGGPLAIHITNRYLDLYPVVQALARSAGKSAMRIHSPADAEQQTLAADWVIVSDAKATGETGQIAPLWTDEYSNLFQVWR